jgi:endonuclease/exonuclease/phosphatase family metal-dependent hydrolase
MPVYRDLARAGVVPPVSNIEPSYSRPEAAWVAERLLDLRRGLRNTITERTRDHSLHIGTWNLRDFDNNKFGHGPRLAESFHYIAEVISKFDICAIQEVNEDLKPLRRIIELLGPQWQFFVTDMTDGRSGNQERMAFVWDTSKVQFRNIVGEIVIPAENLEPGEKQFARTPFVAAFQAGWFKFKICTVHIYYGEDSGEGLQRRIKEIDNIAKTLARRADEDGENYILLGDFNIMSPGHETFKALTRHGFTVPEGIGPSNLGNDMYYDQIAFRAKAEELRFTAAGVLDPYKHVFRSQDYERYAPMMPAKMRKPEPDKDRSYYANLWRTWQISDHKPLWVELEIDFSDSYLRRQIDGVSDIAPGGRAPNVEPPAVRPRAPGTPPSGSGPTTPAPVAGGDVETIARPQSPPASRRSAEAAPSPRLRTSAEAKPPKSRKPKAKPSGEIVTQTLPDEPPEAAILPREKKKAKPPRDPWLRALWKLAKATGVLEGITGRK